MELANIAKKIGTFLNKYRYVMLVLVIGLVMILLPSNKKDQTVAKQEEVSSKENIIETEELEALLQTIHGAGKVKVMLSIAHGEEIIYQKDVDVSCSDGNNSTKDETIVISNSDRNETGLVRQINPPAYLGAIVICEGAENANVRLSITRAVSKITGLSTEHICVLKMK